MARVGIVQFPGTNCERETARAFAALPNVSVTPLWHKDRDLGQLDLVVLPGGFSYGDYLRPGAVARFSPLMEAIVAFAHAGGYVLGICNGFQVLTEAGLLPGALIRNRDLKFIARTVSLRVERNDTPWTCNAQVGQILRIPIAHGDGNWVHHAEDAAKVEAAGQVLLRYCGEDGTVSDAHNPNGSMLHAAGIINAAANVFGLMPHPERAADARLHGDNGRVILSSIVEWIDTRGDRNSESVAMT